MNLEDPVTSSSRFIRLSVLGAKAVGKTAIIVRYLTRRFIGEYRSQIDMSYQHAVSICHQKTRIDITDFSPKNGEDLMPDVETTHCDCFLVVFSIIDRVSFLKAVNIVSVLRSFSSSGSTPITLLGNKKDLEHCRQVSIEELQNLSSLLNCDYAEVSVAESREDIVPIILNLFERVFKNLSAIDEMQKQNQKVETNANISSRNSDSSLDERRIPGSGCKECEKSCCSSECECSKENMLSLSNTPNGSNIKHCEYCSKHYCAYLHRENQLNEGKSFENDVFPSSRRCGRNYSPLMRTQSLQTKERKNKGERRLNRNKKLRTNLSFSSKTTPTLGTPMLLQDSKKDSRITNLLNSSRSSEDSESITLHTFTTKTINSRNDHGSLASLFLRGKSITTQDDHSMLNIHNNGTKTQNKSRKSLTSKFQPSDSTTKKIASEKTKLFRNHSSIIRDSGNSGRSKEHTDVGLDEFLRNRSFTMIGFPSLTINKGSDVPQNLRELTLPRTPGKRERKFGVFGKGVLGNVFSKTSLPDLPKATANLYTKFDSIKKTIKKRSV